MLTKEPVKNGFDLLQPVKKIETANKTPLAKLNAKTLNRDRLLVSTKNTSVKVEPKKALSLDERKVAKKVVDSVRVGVKKTNANLNIKDNMKNSKSDGKSDKKNDQKLDLSVDNDKSKVLTKNLQKVSHSKSKIKISEKQKKGTIKDTLSPNKGGQDKDLSPMDIDDFGRFEKGNLELPKRKGRDLVQDVDLGTIVTQGQKYLLKGIQTEAKVNKNEAKSTLNLGKVSKSSTKSVAKAVVVSKNDNLVSTKFVGNSRSFEENLSRDGNHKGSKDLVKDIELKFFKAMNFKRIVDKNKVKLSSKTQRMQLNLGKTLNLTNVSNNNAVVHTLSNQQTPVADTKNTANNVQKPLNTNPEVLQRFENVQKISNMIKSLTPQNKSMMMRLDPPNLGTVEVRLVTHGKEVLVNFIVKDNDLKDIIKNTSQLLTGQLKLNTNYQKIQINVQTPDDQNQQFKQRDDNQQNQQQGQRHYQNFESEDDEDDSE